MATCVRKYKRMGLFELTLLLYPTKYSEFIVKIETFSDKQIEFFLHGYLNRFNNRNLLKRKK